MKPGDIDKMMREVQKMQAGMLEAQEALSHETVEGSSGGGTVKAVMSGDGELRALEIAPDVVDPDDVEMLQDLVVAAVSDAARRSRELQAERMGDVTGGLGGGLGDLLGP